MPPNQRCVDLIVDGQGNQRRRQSHHQSPRKRLREAEQMRRFADCTLTSLTSILQPIDTFFNAKLTSVKC